MTVYFDTSVVVAFLAAEPDGKKVRLWLSSHPARSAVVSPWVDTEVSSALAQKCRTGEFSREDEVDARALWASAQAAMLDNSPVVPTDFKTASSLCARPDLNLRGPDALHLAIVQRERLTLATFDLGMAKAAGRIGLPLETMMVK